MKRLTKITDWFYEKFKPFATPLFLLIIITKALGYGKFGWVDAAYILAYTFIYLPALEE